MNIGQKAIGQQFVMEFLYWRMIDALGPGLEKCLGLNSSVVLE